MSQEKEEKKMVDVTQKADLWKPIMHAGDNDPPIGIRTVCKKTVYSDSGIIAQNSIEDYIRLSALPDDLKERVKTFISSKYSANGR